LEKRVEERTSELKKANADLSREIASREKAQRELEATHRQLLQISRQAGMAEVATGVLHNVGNVLNSVNVSATLLLDNARKSKVTSLGKVAAVLSEHSADLGDFMSNDPKGKHLPGYLGQLAARLAKEQQNVVDELEALRKNIEHIKDIVAMQQNYAKVSGVTEIVNVTDLVEDALRLNAGALQRHGVQVVREFQDSPTISVETHKVLQILVNLVRNAKYACHDSGRTDKRLTIRVVNGEGGVNISVRDNGVGIPAENLTRIFSHGFTTRKDGHGFGLHNGALTARELGGTLCVHSDGPGQGAMFTLALPLEPSKNNYGDKKKF
jgi:C4-dicarboxylate-specific signal transduction histidine kinase